MIQSLPYLFIRVSVMMASALVLSACQTTSKPVAKPEIEWLGDTDFFSEKLALASTQNVWRYAAKVGVTTPRAKEQANMVWHFSDQANNVRLFGPLGAGAVRLEFDRLGVVLSDQKGVLHRGNSAEELLTRIVGWPIPIDALRYWLFALPNPEEPYRYQLDAAGYVSVLEQQGWQIEYSAYKDYGGNGVSDETSVAKHRLPRKLIASKQLEDQQVVVVKLITKSWKW